mgnify:FL=1
MSEDSLLTFPCNLPVKVIGRNSEDFRSVAGDIVQAHYGDLKQRQIAEQLSKNGSFLSLTFTVHVETRDRADALYRDLTASEDILMVL